MRQALVIARRHAGRHQMTDTADGARRARWWVGCASRRPAPISRRWQPAVVTRAAMLDVLAIGAPAAVWSRSAISPARRTRARAAEASQEQRAAPSGRRPSVRLLPRAADGTMRVLTGCRPHNVALRDTRPSACGFKLNKYRPVSCERRRARGRRDRSARTGSACVDCARTAREPPAADKIQLIERRDHPWRPARAPTAAEDSRRDHSAEAMSTAPPMRDTRTRRCTDQALWPTGSTSSARSRMRRVRELRRPSRGSDAARRDRMRHFAPTRQHLDLADRALSCRLSYVVASDPLSVRPGARNGYGLARSSALVQTESAARPGGYLLQRRAAQGAPRSGVQTPPPGSRARSNRLPDDRLDLRQCQRAACPGTRRETAIASDARSTRRAGRRWRGASPVAPRLGDAGQRA